MMDKQQRLRLAHQCARTVLRLRMAGKSPKESTDIVMESLIRSMKVTPELREKIMAFYENDKPWEFENEGKT